MLLNWYVVVVKMLNPLGADDGYDVDVPVGHIIHTGMQNQWGGYENDCSVARLADNRSVPA